MLRNEQALLPCDHCDNWKDNRMATVSSHFESGLARETRDSYGIQTRKANSSNRGWGIKLLLMLSPFQYRSLLATPDRFQNTPVNQHRPSKSVRKKLEGRERFDSSTGCHIHLPVFAPLVGASFWVKSHERAAR